MTRDPVADVVLGEVLCRRHDAEVELLCMRCLARLQILADPSASAGDAEHFLHVHAHSHPGARAPAASGSRRHPLIEEPS